jgi:integrase
VKGSIQKRVGKRGTSYIVTYDLAPAPVTGKRRQKRETAPTRKEAEALLTKALHQLHSGTYIEPSTIPLGTYLVKWLEAAEATIRPATWHRYQRLIVRHMIPALGSVPLAKLTPLHVQDFYADKLMTLSPGTVGMVHAVLHRALSQAVKWQMLTRNVCDAVDVPQPGKPELSVWTARQARAFLEGTANDPYAALWRLALTTGMRQGELLALLWDDVDLERGTLAVRRTLTIGKDGRYTVGEPKSASGRRSIALPPSCIAALRRHRARQNERRLQWGEAWQETGHVFDRGDGARLSVPTMAGAFHRLIRQLGLPRIRFHDLRHTSATLALAEGVHPKIVAERLGHSNVGMTLNKYSHVSMDMQREAADRLDKALGA